MAESGGGTRFRNIDLDNIDFKAVLRVAGVGGMCGWEEKLETVLDITFLFFPLKATFIWHEGKSKSLSRVRLFMTPWTVTHQAPPTMGFSRQEYWSGLPFPPPGTLPDPGIEPRSPALQADSLPSEPLGKPT